MKTHDTLIRLLLDLEEEMRNRYNAHVEIEYFNESDIYLRVYFAPAGFGFNYRIDTTFIEKEYKHVNVKDLADHISEQIDRKIVEHFKKGNASESVDPNELFAKGGMRMNAFSNNNADYNKGYIAGINRVINKLIHLEILRPEDAPMLAMACLSPDPEPDPFDIDNQLFAKKTTP